MSQPLTYQSQDLSFSNWISLLTLCLAPLIMHVLAGAPSPSYLSDTRPAWHDRICHLNPTSIIWRYLAIADRRIRAKRWDPVLMAATNALFWTPQGWDGSEEMAIRSVPYCTRRPQHSRTEVMSMQTLKTIVVTLQGAQALYDVLLNYPGAPTLLPTGADRIFSCLAIIGLQRLCAALWLTDDFAFQVHDAVLLQMLPSHTVERIDNGRDETRRASFDSLLRGTGMTATNEDMPEKQYFGGSASCWMSRAFRMSVILLQLTILVYGNSSFIIHILRGTQSTVTGQLAGFLYILLFSISVILYGYYFIKGRTTSVIIPCASYFWYKVYTLLVVMGFVVLLIISCIETRRTPCGTYTSLAGDEGDVLACRVARTHLMLVRHFPSI